MSQKEIKRLEVVQKALGREISQVAAAELLNISVRQMRRLVGKYQEKGAEGLVSKRRGRPSNNRLPEDLKEEALGLLTKHYSDFGPTLACEKLKQRHELILSKESVRQLMMKAGLWEGKRRRVAKVHPQRARREALGELVQIDGSPHAWFEDRGESCCLLVIVDDATSQLLGLRFERVESTQAYFRLFKDYVKAYGRPLACYHDKHSIFRVNAKEPLTGTGTTQFKRAMEELAIESIAAHTPQAKGRVERANKTLQDRLVKELRLQGISDLDSANAFLPTFMEQYNEQFAVSPENPEDSHRQSLPDEDILALLFSEQYPRKISKNLEVSFQNKVYQITSKTPTSSIQGARVTVCVGSDGEVTLLYKNKKLPYTIHAIHKKENKVASAKEINAEVNALKAKHSAEETQIIGEAPWCHYLPPGEGTTPLHALA
jgi:transposase